MRQTNTGLRFWAYVTLAQLGVTIDSFASTVPMGRIGQTAEITQAVVFLCSDAVATLRDNLITVDGGSTAS